MYQSPYRDSSQYSDKQNQNYRSITPKRQRQINQVQSTNETSTDPPGIDIIETSEPHLIDIHCQSTDDESETENTLVINMLILEHE